MQTSISARELTRRKAAGMTSEQVAEATETARLHLRLRSWSCEIPQDQAVIRRLGQIHEEWLRISYVMASELMPVYQPDQDPSVQRWARDDARSSQTAARAARQERVVRQSRCGSADLRERETPDTVVGGGTATFRSAEDELIGFDRLLELDRTTIVQLVNWLEGARAGALPARFPA
jgi:hypothetical protein